MENFLDVGAVLKRVGQVFCHAAGNLCKMNIVACRDARSETLVPRHNLHIQQHKGKDL